MPTAKFALEVPPNTWMAEVSTSFPDTRFRLLTGIQNGDEAVELGETVGGETRRADAALAAHPDILDHERLYAGDERVLGRYRTTNWRCTSSSRRRRFPRSSPSSFSAAGPSSR
jgi:hypothetical protein